MRLNIFDEKGQPIGVARNVRIEVEPVPMSAYSSEERGFFNPQPGLQVVIDGFSPAARLTEAPDR